MESIEASNNWSVKMLSEERQLSVYLYVFEDERPTLNIICNHHVSKGPLLHCVWRDAIVVTRFSRKDVSDCWSISMNPLLKNRTCFSCFFQGGLLLVSFIKILRERIVRKFNRSQRPEASRIFPVHCPSLSFILSINIQNIISYITNNN